MFYWPLGECYYMILPIISVTYFLIFMLLKLLFLLFSYYHHSAFLLHPSSNYYFSVFTPEFFGSKTGNQVSIKFISIFIDCCIIYISAWIIRIYLHFFILLSFLNGIYLVNQLLSVAFHPNHRISLSLTLQ